MSDKDTRTVKIYRNKKLLRTVTIQARAVSSCNSDYRKELEPTSTHLIIE